MKPTRISSAISAAALVSTLFAGLALAEDRPPLTENEKINYAVGYQMGTDFKNQGLELDAAMLVQGIRNALEGSTPKIPRPEMQKSLGILKSKITASEQKRKSAQYKTDLMEGKAFLEANAKKEGVLLLPEGLQYKVLKEGSGNSPGLLDNVVVQFTGTLINGSEFYTTRNAGTVPPILVGNLLPGMREVVQRMKPGGRVTAYIPADLGYSAGHPLYGKTTIFEIDLVGIAPAGPAR
jgi:FKBP-type peptidyl-prolyl cis-trans isomerase FklB